MDPSGIIIVFVFMSVLVILGIALTGISVFRLRQLVRDSTEGHPTTDGKAWDRTILIFGLIFIACGLYGSLRLILGS